MARRDRVPRHKSHNHRRNKNPKLSPFQREQKRNKLANQAPTVKTMGTEKDIPKSEQAVFEYLQQRQARQAEKRRLLREQREAEERESKAAVEAAEARNADEAEVAADTGSATHEALLSATQPPTKRARTDPGSSAGSSDAGSAASGTSAAVSAKKLKKVRALAQFPSLNEEMTSDLGKAVIAFKARSMPSSDGNENDSGGGDGEDANRPRTVQEIIAKKKERKHLRKAAARRERVTEKYQALEDELRELLKGSGKKGRKDGSRGSDEEINLAFEKKLKAMQAEKHKEEERLKKAEKQQQGRGGAAAADASSVGRSSAAATAKEEHKTPREQQSRQAAAAAAGTSSEATGKKSITFGEDVDVVAHHAMRYPGDRAATNSDQQQQQQSRAAPKRPQDFYELVDVVRYGERVEAPPVFDVVPNKHSAVTRLASKLEREESRLGGRQRSQHQQDSTRDSGPGLVGVRPALSFGSSTLGSGRKSSGSSASDERYRLLSSVGGLGEQKRLARLGLAPAITGPISVSGGGAGSGGSSGNSKQKEMELLRDRVMATYRQNKRHAVEKKNGVDMKHQFPQFS